MNPPLVLGRIYRRSDANQNQEDFFLAGINPNHPYYIRRTTGELMKLPPQFLDVTHEYLPQLAPSPM